MNFCSPPERMTFPYSSRLVWLPGDVKDVMLKYRCFCPLPVAFLFGLLKEGPNSCKMFL